MVSAGIVALAIAFTAFLFWRGSASAFVRSCWMPLALLVLAWALQRQLGYATILLLVAAVMSSVGLMGFGLIQAVEARRRRLPTARSLALATAIAAAPLLAMAAFWTLEKLR